MVRNQSATLLLFELNSFVRNLRYALGKQNSVLCVRGDLEKNLVGFLSAPESERRHANLSVGSVVENLKVNRLVHDELAHVCLHQQVFRLTVAVVEGQVVDLIKDGADLHSWISASLDLAHEVANDSLGVFG